MSQAKIFRWGCTGWITGIAVGVSPLSALMWIWLFLAGAVSVLAVWHRALFGKLCALFLVIGSLGIAWGSQAMERALVPAWEGEIRGEARVIAEPEMKGRFQEVMLAFERCDAPAVCPEISILGYFLPYETFRYGDVLTLSCILERPKNFDPGFDYVMYLRTQGIGSICRPTEFQHVAEGQGKKIVQGVLSVRRNLEENIARVLPQPEAGLVQGLLFGGDNRLTKELREAFARTGMSHILAVSGQNVAIVATWLIVVALALGLWRRHTLWLALGGVVLFVIMVGAPTSAIRAGVMGSLALLAARSERFSNGIAALFCAAAVMLFWNPLWLRYDAGFQLSFMATLGILLILPLAESFLSRRGSWLWLKEIIVMTLAAEVFVLPLLAYHFHLLPLASFPANLMILPFLPVLMLLGFLVAVSGMIIPWAAWAVGIPAYALAQWELGLVMFFAQAEKLSVSVPDIPISWIFLWYGVLIGSVVWFSRRRRELWMGEVYE